ncbi:MAG: pyrroloquinoline quinone biosynthesis peptide chaperone PqqD [Bryobacteraceae bacterium]|jgi:pyrroloquinoline quinone biosynthesis protein D
MTPASIPRLARGCRLSEDPAQGWVLLIPEGVLRLSGPGPRILQRCDGSRSFADIVRELGDEFAVADTGLVQTETAAFLDRLVARRIVVVE